MCSDWVFMETHSPKQKLFLGGTPSRPARERSGATRDRDAGKNISKLAPNSRGRVGRDSNPLWVRTFFEERRKQKSVTHTSVFRRRKKPHHEAQAHHQRVVKNKWEKSDHFAHSLVHIPSHDSFRISAALVSLHLIFPDMVVSSARCVRIWVSWKDTHQNRSYF